MKSSFVFKLNAVLDSIDSSYLHYDAAEAAFFHEEFERLDAYAAEHDLLNTAIAMRAVRAVHSGQYRSRAKLLDGTNVPKPYFCHCLSVCRMLINLSLPLTDHDKDIMLAAALCHDAPAFNAELRKPNALSERYHLDPAVSELVALIYTRNCTTEDELKALLARVSRNRLGVLIKLADRGHVVESLYELSVWRANEYIHETRTLYLPMCIYAREYFADMDRALGVLQEKLHDLIEATEIFLMRYTDLEREMTTQILRLEEDNAHMRMLIRKISTERP